MLENIYEAKLFRVRRRLKALIFISLVIIRSEQFYKSCKTLYILKVLRD